MRGWCVKKKRRRGCDCLLGISSACFYPEKTENTVSVIAELGYTRAEFFLNTHREFSSAFLSELKKMCLFSGITPVSVHPYTSFAEPNFFFSDYPRRFDDGLELYKQYFQASAEFGARFFVFHGGLCRQRAKMPPERYAERYAVLHDTALAEGVTLCQENVVDHLCGNSEYVGSLKKLLGKNIAFALDLKQANRAGEDPMIFAEMMGQQLMHCHVNDFDPEHSCLLPGFGDFDIRELYRRLNMSGYQGDLITEVYSNNYTSLDEIVQSRKKLQKILTE